jgi:hypothetical protein
MVPAAESHGQNEVPPESEGQLWQLEREIGRSDGGSAGKLPRCRSSHPRSEAQTARCDTRPRYNFPHYTPLPHSFTVLRIISAA